MATNGHTQKDIVAKSRQSQSQVSKFLGGKRQRVTEPIRQICQYAGIDIDAESAMPHEAMVLSPTVRQALVDNPRGAEILARVIHALVPVLSSLRAETPKDVP